MRANDQRISRNIGIRQRVENRGNDKCQEGGGQKLRPLGKAKAGEIVGAADVQGIIGAAQMVAQNADGEARSEVLGLVSLLVLFFASAMYVACTFCKKVNWPNMTVAAVQRKHCRV